MINFLQFYSASHQKKLSDQNSNANFFTHFAKDGSLCTKIPFPVDSCKCYTLYAQADRTRTKRGCS